MIFANRKLELMSVLDVGEVIVVAILARLDIVGSCASASFFMPFTKKYLCRLLFFLKPDHAMVRFFRANASLNWCHKYQRVIKVGATDKSAHTA